MSRSVARALPRLVATTAAIAAVTLTIAFLRRYVSELSLLVLYLPVVLLVAALWRTAVAVAVAVLSVVVFEYLFVPPRYTPQIGEPRDLLSLAVFLAAAVVVGQLAARLRQTALMSARMSEEQSALRRVATLVARSASPTAVFEAVAREAGQLCGADLARLERYEPDGTVTRVAVWSRELEPLAVGTRFELDGPSIARDVRQAGGPVRIDTFQGAAGEIAREARALGIRSSIGCPIEVAGHLWGVVAASTRSDRPFPPTTEAQLASLTELVATAIENAEARTELMASRARVVATADQTRRRIERDLHDGAQQRLVSLALQIRAAQAAVPPDLDDLGARLEHAAADLTDALDDLREIARGLHPAMLAQGGLAPALKGLARRSPLPVELELWIERRVPERVEISAYYLVAEALTNAIRHAHATGVTVTVETRGDCVLVAVRDDGRGGAAFDRGTGLVGLKDRVEALGGRLTLDSPHGAGTVLRAEFPPGPSVPGRR